MVGANSGSVCKHNSNEMTANSKELLEAAERLEMIWEEKRYETFTSWPFAEDKPCSAYKLAEAGFFFTGSSREPDAVQCFLCEKALDGWDEDDDPWAEHVSHAPKCDFAILRQPEEALTFVQFSNFFIKLCEKVAEKTTQAVMTKSSKEFNIRLAKLKRGLTSKRK